MDEPQIPKHHSFKPITSKSPSLWLVKNCVLLNCDSWDKSKLREVFLPMDVEEIVKIKIRRDVDKLVWHFLMLFTVKYGYKVAMKLKSRSALRMVVKFGVFFTKSFRFQRCGFFVWSLPLQRKLKIFVWQCCKNWLTVWSNLRNRGMSVSPYCPMCKKHDDTTQFMFQVSIY